MADLAHHLSSRYRHFSTVRRDIGALALQIDNDGTIKNKGGKMCETRSEATTKIDKLTLAMHRLASALERVSIPEAIEGQRHLDAGHFSGGSRGDDLSTGDLSLKG